jgi:hypothetical protein
MPKKYTEALINEQLQILTETPQRILACTKGLDESQLATRPSPDEWSIVEMLAHLRGSAEVWSASIYGMLNQSIPMNGPNSTVMRSSLLRKTSRRFKRGEKL